MARRCPRFVVNAFNTKIAPFSPTLQRTEQTTAPSDELAVAFLLKAVVREDNLAKMSDLFHTQFPGLVCTVTAGGAVAERKTTATRIAGTIRLFGMDQVGQLAKISEVLHACGMTILNLYVTTGVCDVETCEFVVREGGPLSENVITVAAMNKETFEEEAFRNEVEDASQEVGYAVTSIILEGEKHRPQQLARYYLNRKSFMGEWAKGHTKPSCILAASPRAGSSAETEPTAKEPVAILPGGPGMSDADTRFALPSMPQLRLRSSIYQALVPGYQHTAPSSVLMGHQRTEASASVLVTLRADGSFGFYQHTEASASVLVHSPTRRGFGFGVGELPAHRGFGRSAGHFVWF
ncbi:unnamed protein product [Symbiodinium sp. KB8]|nr:unnamed protein product [Symbiodinium sp. KB8]